MISLLPILIRFLLFLVPLAVELKREFHRLRERVLDIHIYRLLLGGSGCVVEPELLFRKRVTVIGLETVPLSILNLPLPSG